VCRLTSKAKPAGAPKRLPSEEVALDDDDLEIEHDALVRTASSLFVKIEFHVFMIMKLSFI
jgi:hypothetical protein